MRITLATKSSGGVLHQLQGAPAWQQLLAVIAFAGLAEASRRLNGRTTYEDEDEDEIGNCMLAALTVIFAIAAVVVAYHLVFGTS